MTEIFLKFIDCILLVSCASYSWDVTPKGQRWELLQHCHRFTVQLFFSFFLLIEDIKTLNSILLKCILEHGHTLQLRKKFWPHFPLQWKKVVFFSLSPACSERYPAIYYAFYLFGLIIICCTYFSSITNCKIVPPADVETS